MAIYRYILLDFIPLFLLTDCRYDMYITFIMLCLLRMYHNYRIKTFIFLQRQQISPIHNAMQCNAMQWNNAMTATAHIEIWIKYRVFAGFFLNFTLYFGVEGRKDKKNYVYLYTLHRQWSTRTDDPLPSTIFFFFWCVSTKDINKL